MSIHFLEVCQQAVEENNKEAFEFLIRYELAYPDETTEGFMPSFMVASLDNAEKELFLIAYKNLQLKHIESLVREIEAPGYNRDRLLTILDWLADAGSSIDHLISLSEESEFIKVAQEFRS